jgi:hypothetical protein
MRDEKHRQTQSGPQVREEVQDRSLHADVERTDRFVSDNHARIHGQRTRDADSLTLTPGQVPRSCVERPSGQTNTLQQFLSLRSLSSAANGSVAAQKLDKHGTNGEAAVETGLRILEHHLGRPLLTHERSVLSRSPSKSTVPLCGDVSPAIVRARVDLPHPDSPTTPRTSPGMSCRLTPSTAFNMTLRCPARTGTAPANPRR